LLPAKLSLAAQNATPDVSIEVTSPTLEEVLSAAKKLNMGKAAGVCGIHPEFI